MCEINIQRIDHYKNYTTIDLTCANDKRLSWGAVGLHLYLYSRATIQGWKIKRQDLLSRHKEGTRALQSLVNELKGLGYLKIENLRDQASGQFRNKEYLISEIPMTEWIEKETDRPMENPTDGKPDRAETALSVNTQKTESLKTVTEPEKPLSIYNKDNINNLNTKKDFKIKSDIFYLNLFKKMTPKQKELIDTEGLKRVRLTGPAVDQKEIDQGRIEYLKKLHKNDQLGEFQPFFNQLEARERKESLIPANRTQPRLIKEILARAMGNQ